MKTVVFGASGATGKLLVEQLIKQNQQVRAVVRTTSKIPQHWEGDRRIEVMRTSVSALNLEEMTALLKGCNAVASCLGHNLSWKGVYGKPRKLVTNAVKLIVEALEEENTEQPAKVVLMNTAGNRNRDLKERISIGQRVIIQLLRWLLPPHPDNEKAADHLRLHVGQRNTKVEWVVVRPDTLIDEEHVNSYTAHPSPTRSALFNPGKTSRIQVGHFMASLIADVKLWEKWKGQMPVIYKEM